MFEEVAVRITTVAGQKVVEVSGEVDLANSPAMREAIASQMDSGDPVLIVDLSAVTFMDSSGLNVLAGAAKRLGPSAVRVAGCRPNIQRLFKLSGLEAVFCMYDTVEDAVEDLSGPLQ